jgi:hypothetical protein
MYECKICNYSTDRKFSLEKHLKTQKHLTNVKNNKFCNICNKEYSTRSNYTKHVNIHHPNINDNIDNNNNNNIDNNIIDINNNNNINNKNTNILIKNNKQIISQMTNVLEEVKEVKEEVKEVNKTNKEVKKVVNKAIHKASSLIKYLMEHHKTAPPLKKIKKDECINLLKIEFKCTEEDDKDNYLEKKFISDYSGNKFISNISKCILNIVHTDDPSQQPIWNSDCSRLHYVIKTSINVWNEDKAGIQFTDFVIRPILKSICDRITNYRKEIIEKKDISKYKIDDYIEHNKLLSSVYNFEYALIRGELIKPILKELAPYLRYVKKELEELENKNDVGEDDEDVNNIKEDNNIKIEELEHIQEELQEIAEENGYELTSESESDID